MVTHDVDEAVLLSDRIVMMTNGPAATIGDIVDVNLVASARAPRARQRYPLSPYTRPRPGVSVSEAVTAGGMMYLSMHEPAGAAS